MKVNVFPVCTECPRGHPYYVSEVGFSLIHSPTLNELLVYIYLVNCSVADQWWNIHALPVEIV